MKTLLALLIILAPAVVLAPAAVAAPAPQVTPQQIEAIETSLVDAMNRRNLQAFEQILANVPPDAVLAMSTRGKFGQALDSAGDRFHRVYSTANREAMSTYSAGPGQGQRPVSGDAVSEPENVTDTVVKDATAVEQSVPPEIGITGMTTPVVVTAAVVVGVVAVTVANQNDDKAQGPSDTTGGL